MATIDQRMHYLYLYYFFGIMFDFLDKNMLDDFIVIITFTRQRLIHKISNYRIFIIYVEL